MVYFKESFTEVSHGPEQEVCLGNGSCASRVKRTFLRAAVADLSWENHEDEIALLVLVNVGRESVRGLWGTVLVSIPSRSEKCTQT